MDKILFNHNNLKDFTSIQDYSGAARLLLNEQKKVWYDLEKAYASLKSVQVKTFQYDGFVIKIQHNPGRLRSSSARVDEKSIKERKCFLCYENLYQEQQALKYDEEFLILVNPFPILPEHFTIPHNQHIPQTIKEYFGKMLSLSKDMQRDVIIYNGPHCGASAPDHLHFQAGTKFFMPLDDEFHSIKNEYGEIIFEDDSIVVSGMDDGLRKIISFESAEKSLMGKALIIFYDLYKKVSNGEIEPMMNILSLYDASISEEGKQYGWKVIIFLRKKHRPSHYFKEGEDRILLSPAAVDFGGVCILPFEKDFDKIKKDVIKEIFEEVSLGKEEFDYLKVIFKKNLNILLY